MMDSFTFNKYCTITKLVVSVYNGCTSSITFHTHFAISNSILTHKECIEIRNFQSDDPKISLLIEYVLETINFRGRIREETLKEMMVNGFNVEKLEEIISVITKTLKQNYIKLIAHYTLDHPKRNILEEDRAEGVKHESFKAFRDRYYKKPNSTNRGLRRKIDQLKSHIENLVLERDMYKAISKALSC